MFSSQISSERSGAKQATEVLGQEFLDQISPEGHMFMFYLFRLEPFVEFLFMLLCKLLMVVYYFEAYNLVPRGTQIPYSAAVDLVAGLGASQWLLPRDRDRPISRGTQVYKLFKGNAPKKDKLQKNQRTYLGNISISRQRPTTDGRSNLLPGIGPSAILRQHRQKPTPDGRPRPIVHDRVQDRGSHPTPLTQNILPFPEHLYLVTRNWVTDRESLKIVIEKSFNESIIKHFKLGSLYGELGWVPLLCFFGNFYLDLVCEFYASMLHKTEKDLKTIISTIKGVRIILTREHLASVLGISDEENLVTVDSKKKAIDKDSEWNYDVAYYHSDI
ncbi:hypothetical protein M9H77_29531 [Catharanthus roseus]|uniref:Uncharacterized protein n=1 Tax=Catharanthus roseus TaxID=4058 RepID=A0ACB9ZV02_CATRO|nr:hypothetical protein M9H77_29531 [Catharanthus roseus]